MFSLSTTDYISWAKGLQECGYATDPNYAKKLIGTIEKYELYKYDSKELLANTHDFQQVVPDNLGHALPQTFKQEIVEEETLTDIPEIFILPDDYQRNTYLSMIGQPGVVQPDPEIEPIYSLREEQAKNNDLTENTSGTDFSNDQAQQIRTKRPTMAAPSYNIEVTTLNMIKEKVMITKGNTENNILQLERKPRTNSSLRR